MKRLLVFCLLSMIIFSGCSNPHYDSAVGDFSFYPPEGYSIENVSDLNCVLVRQEDATVVGGMELTSLKEKSLTSKRDDSILMYLLEQFHETNNVEFVLQRWDNGNPMVTVHLRKHEDNDTQTTYSHVFFRKESYVYHLWLNEDQAGDEAVDAFIKVLE